MWVSIHASARDATRFSHMSKSAMMFQSTRPRGTRHVVTFRVRDIKTGFNPRVRAGRDLLNP